MRRPHMSAQRASIVGRATERRRVVEFLDAIVDGPVALLVEGEAGIGKTAVWREAVALARERGCAVVACRPVESETQLGYAALGDLLEAVSEDALASLPAPQRHAIDVALLRAEPEAESSLPRAVAIATLGVLRSLAADGPIVVAIDDVQWLDQPSEDALAFALRRLTTERIGLLVAQRVDPGVAMPRLDVTTALPEPRVRRLQLGPLDRTTLGRIVADRHGRVLPPPALARLHAATAGNPFYALEVSRAASGTEPGGDLPVPTSLAQVVGERLEGLSPASLQAVELTAALSRPTRAVVAAVIGEPADGAIEEAVRAGALEVDADRVRLAHPLIGSVAYERVSPADRRELHGRLAVAVDDPEERATHLALATELPDAEVARILDDAARRATARGAPATAADLLEHARRLTPAADEADLLRRTIAAAERHFDAGYIERARALLDEAAQTAAPGEPRARVLARLGWVRAQVDGFHAGAELFRRAAAERFDDVGLRIDIEGGLAWCLHETVNAADGLVHARRALDLAEGHGDPAVLAGALSHVAFLETLEGNGVALARSERAIGLAFRRDWSQILGRPDWVHGMLLQWAGDLPAAHAVFERVHRDAVERGDLHVLPFVLFHLARIELLAGDWPAAQEHALDADRTALESGQVSERPYSHAIVALVDAHLGRVDETLARVELGLASYEELGVAPAGIELLAARGFLAVSLEDWAAADEALEEARGRAETKGLREPALFRLHGDAIEAKVALGRLEEAQERLAELDDFAETLDRPILRAIAGRCRGLLLAAQGELAAASPPLEDALVLHAEAGQPFEEARTLLVLGSVQRRGRQKRSTRETLDRAAERFDELGARLWSERVRSELARVGGRRAPAADLTPTEARIAELIAAGRTYRETADALFISPKTVQWNLSKIYRKLGVRSRAELAALLGGTAAGPAAAEDRPAGS
jgi:DNA-binding CsgD family transcriptional regulator